jgi:hypothetical protein
MNADAERSITDLVARALQHNDERSQDMTRIDDITEQYARLLRNEGEATRALAKAREDLKTSREADVKAYADSALDGNEPAKRKELTVKHKAENLEVCALPGYVLAFDLLAANAVEAVQEGRRQLDDHELRILRGRLFPFTERPESLIDFVSAAFDASDRQHDADEHARYMKQGYQIAIKHVQEAKGLHERRQRTAHLHDGPVPRPHHR